MTNFVNGKHLYVDDLVTASRWRSHGYGRRLNDHLVETAAREELRDHPARLGDAPP